MDADWLLQLLTQLTFFAIFLLVVADAVRERYRAKVDVALFFGAMAFALGIAWVSDAVLVEPHPLLLALARALIIAMPYLLLRIVADFSDVPHRLVRAAFMAMAIGIAGVFLVAELPPPILLLIVVYFVGIHGYAAAKFVRKAGETAGVTARRMQAAAFGSVLLALAIMIAGVRAALAGVETTADMLIQLGVLGAGLAYLVGFAPPRFLRRAWQQPELRALLARVAELPRLPDTATVLRELEKGAASALGAERATILLWDPDERVLWSPGAGGAGSGLTAQPGQFIAGQAFEQQQPLFSANAPADDPDNARIYREWDARAVIAAPISVADERLGVLSVYTARPPIFARDDLELLQLLAEQAAVVIESRRLLEDAAVVRARAEATRLKDDFLSAAAHDLKTPLTAVIAYTQLIERRAAASPGEPIDPLAISRIAAEAERLRALVARLLDVARSEHARLATERRPVELVTLAREVCGRFSSERHPCMVDAASPVVVEADDTRLSQLVSNLVENAVKYSPKGGKVSVGVWDEDSEARLAVSDRGVGIPPADLPYVFDRFRRASNLDDRRFAGMGLGLYICRLIVEEHGGRIWAESQPGTGSTFHVALPRARGVEAV